MRPAQVHRVLGPAIMFAVAAMVAPAPSVRAAPPPVPAAGTLEGAWDTVIESPKRPWNFTIVFAPQGQGWTGRLLVEGLAEFPLSDVTEQAGHVGFRFPRELDSMAFEGARRGAEIIGQVVEEGRTERVRLTRAATLPAPADRVEAWRQDLDVAATRLSEWDRSFSAQARRSFRLSVDRLKKEVPRLDDAEILVALSRAVALADNAHTRFRLDPTAGGTFSTVFPIRVWWFTDGLYVVRAAPGHERALGCRLVSIDGHPIAEVRRQVASLFAGTSAWVDYLAPIYMMQPDVLRGLWIIRSAGQASFTFEDPQGSRFTIDVHSERADRDSGIQESWQELSPLIPEGHPDWATALPRDPASLPLYLRHPDRPYWFEYLDGPGMLYLQYNHSDNAEEGPGFEEFGASVLAFAATHPPRAVVVDLRLNSGGNLDVAKDFFERLADDPALDQRGRLFVITGHGTFSAGLYHAAQLKQLTQATFVGETVGDRLDYWAEGGRIVLPNSRAGIDYANGFHRYSGTPYPDRQPYYEELGIRSLDPDIPVPTTSRDYLARRDPVLEAIEAALAEHGQGASP
jgi:hypothetical protein